MSRTILLFVFLLLLTPFGGYAKASSISLAEVEQFLDQNGGRLQELLNRELERAYERLDLSMEGGEPVFHFSEGDVILEGECDSRSRLEQVDGTITLRNTSRAALRAVSFSRPVSLQFSLDVDLLAAGRIAQEWGIGSERHCNRYADYTFDFDATGDLLLGVDVTFHPQIEYLDGGIRYTPIPSVRVWIERSSYTVDVKDKTFSSLIRKKIDSYLQPYLDPAAAEAFSLQLERRLRQSIIDAWGAEYLLVRLPELDRQRLEEMVAGLKRRLEDEEFDPEDHLGELYYLLLSGDETLWDSLLDVAAICELGEKLMADMPIEPLYQRRGESCTMLEPDGAAEGLYYADAACQRPVRFTSVDLKSYCAELSGAKDVEVTENASPWFLSPATRLDIGVESIDNNHQPYTSRVLYKRAGSCALEMRIHRRSPADENLEPLMMVHGGSWERRRNGLLGMESQISHYTEQGFVVFVPTYRLVGDTEGESGCNGADGEAIVADVADALAWIEAHGTEYGARPGPVNLFGQSAGGLLALRVAMERPEVVRRMLLLYPATDFGDFLARWQAGELGNDPDGLAAMEAFLGRPAAEIRIDDPAIARNSLPAIVARQPGQFPPMFIIHGSGDSLVPVSQSVRLCNALSGDPLRGPVVSVPMRVAEGRGSSYVCDERGSQLHVVTAAEHMLDGCLFSLLCPAGGSESQAVTRKFLRMGRSWLLENSSGPMLPPGMPTWRR